MPGAAVYEGLIGDTFTVGMSPYRQTVDVILRQVSAATAGDPLFESFSLLFDGPPDPFISQNTYFLFHPQLPPQLLLLVPVGQTSSGFQYEVIFHIMQEGAMNDAASPPQGDPH